MKILIVDDHAIVRAGLKRLLATMPHTDAREAATGKDALAAYREERADIVLLDINLPGIGGLELLGRILLLDKNARVIMFTMHAEAVYAGRALEAGALGYLSKNAAPDEILAAVRKVSEGGRYIENEIAQELALQPAPGSDPMKQLSERDLEILRLLGEGRSLAEIAEALGVGYKTVANTSSQIKNKLGVTRTADLIRLSIEMGVAR
jgi:DNA-binding NarL/FixJ family response regulator